jgi:hypothetical protein
LVETTAATKGAHSHTAFLFSRVYPKKHETPHRGHHTLDKQTRRRRRRREREICILRSGFLSNICPLVRRYKVEAFPSGGGAHEFEEALGPAAAASTPSAGLRRPSSSTCQVSVAARSQVGPRALPPLRTCHLPLYALRA